METFLTADLLPFQSHTAGEGTAAIMVSHNIMCCVDEEYPASLSPAVHAFLREVLPFDGVVMTDGLDMGAVKEYAEGGNIAVTALQAGNDMLLSVSKNFIDIIEKAVLSGEIPESRIDDACQRVLDMKEKVGLFENPCEVMDRDACLAETDRLNHEIAKRAISLVCDNNKLLPLNPDKVKSVCIIYQGTDEEIFESLKFMEDELKKHGVEKVHIQTALHDEPEPSTLPLGFDIMLYVPCILRNKPWGVLGFQGEIYKTMYRVTAGNQIGKRIVINLGTPAVYYDYYTTFDCFINAYNPSEMTQRYAIKALYGDIPFEGGHPFRLIPKGYEINY
jgi:hypothetical protein